MGSAGTPTSPRAHNTNELTDITPFGGRRLKILTGDVAGGVGTTIQVLQPGVPINSFYVYAHPGNGKPIYKDVNGGGSTAFNEAGPVCGPNWDGIINQDDLAVPRPRAEMDSRPFVLPGQGQLGSRASRSGPSWATTCTTTWLPTWGTYRELTQGSPYNLHTSVLETGFATQQLNRITTWRMRPSCGWTT